MSRAASLLTTRGLNYARREHLPTYVGLRRLIEGTDPQYRADWVDGYTRRQGLSMRPHSYWEYQSFKCCGDDGRIEYRNRAVGSPATILGETWLVQKIAVEPAFATPSCAYSYLWPESQHGSSSYQYFVHGYTRRQDDITTALSDRPEHCVLFMDIRSFYPSVNKKVASTLFEQRISKSSMSVSDRDGVQHILQQLVHAPGIKGLPIGPDPSHFLGHLVLEEVDSKLFRTFKSRYLRYVDDLAIVIPTREREETKRTVSNIIRDAGFEINDDKTDEVSLEEWREFAPHSGGWLGTDIYRELLRRLQVYLTIRPDDYDDLRTVFIGSGFTLPLSRLRAISKTRTVKWWVSHYLSDWEGLRAQFVDRPHHLRRIGLRVRDALLVQFHQLVNRPVPAKAILRRWYIQKLRFFSYRLLRLLPVGALSDLRQVVSTIPELTDVLAVIYALQAQSAAHLLSFSGTPVNMFAQLALESGVTHIYSPADMVLTPDQVDGAATLALHGLWNPCATEISTCCTDQQKALLDLCWNGGSAGRVFSDMGYVDELQTLSLGATKNNVRRVLMSRVNDDEDVLFDESDPGMYFFA